MSDDFIHHTVLSNEDETARLADAMVRVLSVGDVVLLAGSIGSGKTHFCRAFVKARLKHDGAPDEDVPSPTFTLVQTYDTGTVEIWHADLYRLTHPDEVEELGLIEAFETQICLVEWPDRLGELAPKDALELTFERGANDTERRLALHSGDPRWRKKLDTILAEFPHE